MTELTASLYRYPDRITVISRLDPLMDLINLHQSLRATGVSQEMLRLHHGFTTRNEIGPAARAIAAHAETATRLLEQALAGPSEQSFLPGYYALLNLAKIAIIAGGKLAELSTQRWHGASYPGLNKTAQSPLTETIHLHKGGAIALLYQVITGEEIPVNAQINRHRVRKIGMREIYRFLMCCNYEVEFAFKVDTPFALIVPKFELSDDAGAVTLTIEARRRKYPQHLPRRRELRLLRKGFRKVKDNVYLLARPIRDGEFSSQIRPFLRSFLLYVVPSSHSIRNGRLLYSPLSASRLLWPEELPIILSFFHLSNLVRYNPEALLRFYEQPAGLVFSALARHGILRYLELSWSYITQREHVVTS